MIHKTVHIAAVGENVTLQCKLSKLYEVVQVTWQKENGKAKTNLATYSEADGSKVLGKDQSHVQISQSGLSISALTFLGVQLKDDGCYNCIFNTFPLGSIPGRTCLKVYSKLSDLKNGSVISVEPLLIWSCFTQFHAPVQ